MVPLTIVYILYKCMDVVKDENYWKNIIDKIDIRFIQVENRSYYLYYEYEKYYLSLISPEEWHNKKCEGEFVYNNNRYKKI